MRPVRLPSDQPPRSKYGVRHDAAGKAARTVDGILFDSRHEAKVWGDLKLREQAGEIRNLQRQTVYPLVVGAVTVAKYVCDFEFWEKFANSLGMDDWRVVRADAKSPATRLNRVYRLKFKLMQAIWHITVREL